MREIIFRGKAKGTGEWVYGDLAHYRSNISYDTTGEVIEPGEPYIRDWVEKIDTGMYGCCYAVISETLGQFSGVLDHNNDKIFEGDIVRMSYTGKYLGVNGTAEVVFRNGKFGVLWGWHKEFVCLDGFANTKIEVIGNVFDNPQLLEDENYDE